MGPEEKRRAATIFNSTFVRPSAFYINGFSNIPYAKYYYVFMCFLYVVTVLGNGLVLSVIYLVKTLHTPQYMIVFHLAFIDLCGSTALIPKVLDTFLFDNRYIVYEACLSYMFFVWFFGGLQSWTLVTMAFDRFAAICFPLRYHNIVTKPVIASMLLYSWAVLLIVFALSVGLIDRLSFCGSLVVQSFFCDHGPIFRLACNDTFLNNTMVYGFVVMIICAPLILIALSYVCIAAALSKITSGEQRLKALKTCTSHLILVAIFFLPLLGTNLAVLTSSIHPNARIINSTLTHTIPALLNPIIYSLKTDSVLNSIRKLTRNRLSKHTFCRRLTLLLLLY